MCIPAVDKLESTQIDLVQCLQCFLISKSQSVNVATELRSASPTWRNSDHAHFQITGLTPTRSERLLPVTTTSPLPYLANRFEGSSRITRGMNQSGLVSAYTYGTLCHPPYLLPTQCRSRLIARHTLPIPVRPAPERSSTVPSPRYCGRISNRLIPWTGCSLSSSVWQPYYTAGYSRRSRLTPPPLPSSLSDSPPDNKCKYCFQLSP